MATTYPRIDELVQGQLRDGSFRIIKTVDAQNYDLGKGADGSYNTPAGEADALAKRWLAGEFNAARSYLPPDSVMFIDTETRGLTRRNQIWMIGTAYCIDSNLTLDLHIARDPLEEERILRSFADVNRQNSISFNGSTFDLDRLSKRAEAHVIPLAPHKKHVDVYRMLRQFARIRGLERGTLLEFEKVFWPRFQIPNHISGADIPKAYEDYTNDGDPKPIVDSIEHNAYDVITLAALYLKIISRSK